MLIRYTALFQDDGHDIVECKFDYFRKDRRTRCYVMEDENDATRLVCILQPIVKQVQSVKKSSDTMEVCILLCLDTDAYH